MIVASEGVCRVRRHQAAGGARRVAVHLRALRSLMTEQEKAEKAEREVAGVMVLPQHPDHDTSSKRLDGNTLCRDGFLCTVVILLMMFEYYLKIVFLNYY